jgi:hypothetical protein
MYLKGFVRQYKLSFVIVLFLVIFSLVHYIKPALIYNKDGSFRQFGVGYRSKTIFSMWVFAIILAIFSYLAIQYYLMFA